MMKQFDEWFSFVFSEKTPNSSVRLKWALFAFLRFLCEPILLLDKILNLMTYSDGLLLICLHWNDILVVIIGSDHESNLLKGRRWRLAALIDVNHNRCGGGNIGRCACNHIFFLLRLSPCWGATFEMAVQVSLPAKSFIASTALELLQVDILMVF